jgi:toxin secretion/phage lysis holin
MNCAAFLITFVFIVFDFFSGLVKAFATNHFTSTKMREGLFHKIGLVLCVVLGYLIDFAQVYLDLGFSVPVTGAICTYIVLMEISSILENLCEMNPNLMPDKLTEIFGGGHHE